MGSPPPLGKPATAITPCIWGDLAAQWSNEFPTSLAAIVTTEALDDWTDLQNSIKTLRGCSNYVWQEIVTPDELPFNVGIDAWCFLERAAYLAQLHNEVGRQGYTTWTRALSYQTGYFAARSFLAMTGCITLRERSRDSWCQIELRPLRTRKTTIWSIQAMTRSRVTQKETWDLLRGTLNKVSIPDSILKPELRLLISNSPQRDFATIRNRLQYVGGFWIDDDIGGPGFSTPCYQSKDWLGDMKRDGFTDDENLTNMGVLSFLLLEAAFLLWSHLGQSCIGIQSDVAQLRARVVAPLNEWGCLLRGGGFVS